MKPWEEKYENKSVNPWDEDYSTAEEPEDFMPQIEEEMHPAVSWKDRAVVKNFGTPEGSLKYLKGKYPNLEVREQNGRFLFKGANEDKYKVLDPDAEGFDGFGEFAMDASDLVTDIGQGIGEGAATVGGAVLAGAGTAGMGALAGGMAAGGAAGTGLETLKQGIAKQLGVRDEFSGSDIIASGAFGAASPLLFGTGAGLKAGAKEGLKGAMAKLSEKGTFGVVGGAAADAAADVIAPNLAEFTTGIKANVWRKYKDNPDKIADMNNKDFTDIGVETFDQLDGSVKKLKKEVGQEFNQLEADGHLIDLSDVQNNLKDDYEDMLTSGDPMSEAVGRKMKQMYDDSFTSYGTDIDASVMGFEQAQKIKQKMAQAARYDKTGAGRSSRSAAIEEQAAKAGDNYYSLINEQWDETLEGFGTLRAKYADIIEMEDVIGSYKTGKGVGRKFKEKAVKAMMGLDSASPAAIAKSEELLEIASRLGIDDIAERADLMGTYKALRDPSFLPVSGTATSTSRTMSNMSLGALTGASPAVSAGVGMVGLGPSMMKRYMNVGAKGSDIVKGVRDKMPMNRHKWVNMYMNKVEGNNEEKR